MLSAISLAGRSVYLEMYIFEEDTKGFDFISELERKAREGLKVILILDSLGSYDLKAASVDRLRVAGVEVLFFSHFWKRTHRKLLIVDEHIVFIGGVNISRHYAPWRDLQVRLSGAKFAESALQSFRKVYLSLGGKDPELLVHRHAPTLERAKLWFIEHGMQAKRNTLRRYYEEHIAAAKEHITLVTPYFIPRRWLIAQLHTAILRGVKVSVIIPSKTDHPIIDRVNYRYLSLFRNMGATCLVTPEMNHAKAMVIDDTSAIVGSHNLDALSFEHNIEGGVFFEEKHMVEQLAAIIADWKKNAMPLEELPRFHWYDVLVALLLPFFESVL